MKFLNGVENKERVLTGAPAQKHEFSINLPEKVDENLISEISNRIERMNKNYSLFVRRNRILSAIAILNTDLNEIENEINGL